MYSPAGCLKFPSSANEESIRSLFWSRYSQDKDEIATSCLRPGRNRQFLLLHIFRKERLALLLIAISKPSLTLFEALCWNNMPQTTTGCRNLKISHRYYYDLQDRASPIISSNKMWLDNTLVLRSTLPTAMVLLKNRFLDFFPKWKVRGQCHEVCLL